MVIFFIVGGVLGLVYGSFSYIKDIIVFKFGLIEFKVEEKEMVNVFVWVGIGVIVVGVVLLVVGGKKG